MTLQRIALLEPEREGAGVPISDLLRDLPKLLYRGRPAAPDSEVAALRREARERMHWSDVNTPPEPLLLVASLALRSKQHGSWSAGRVKVVIDPPRESGYVHGG